MARKVDTTAIKVNQALIVALVLVAFLFDLPWLVLAVAAVLAVGTAWLEAALFQQAYQHVLRPAGLLRPHIIDDDPVPHRFAQGMGAAFLALSVLVLLVLDAPALGWGLALLVAVLAAINLVFNFCAGCFVYYQLARLGVVRRPASTQ